MADENKTAYASREWHTGDIITADALNKIENEMEYVSEEVTNAVTGTINNQKLNDTIARKLDSIVKYFPEEPTEENLENVRMYVQQRNDNGEITVPTIDDYQTFKANFVQPYTNKAYAIGDYVEYGNVIYKVLSAITKNSNLTDDEAWAALIAQTPSPVTSIDVMQELNGLINVYTSDNQITPERNKIWIKQQGESVEVPTYEEFTSLSGSIDDLKSAIPIEQSTILNTVHTGYVYNSFKWEVGYVNSSGVIRTDIYRGLISPLMHNSEWNGYVIYNANPSKYEIIKYFYDPATEEYIGKSTISSYPHTMPYTSERKTRLFVRDSATSATVELTSAELMAMRAAINVKSTIPYVIDIPQLTALDNYISSEGVYPFTADSTLYRPGYPDQIVYSQELNGIVDLIVYANDLDTYFVQTLYAYHTSLHESVITITSSVGRTGTYSAVRSSSTDKPIETITINDTNGDLLAKATIDWARINKANGLGLTAESTRIAEGCIIRTVSSDNIRALPITDYYVTNVQQRIYFDEIFRGYNGGYFVVTATGATYPEITYTDRYVQFAFTSTKDVTVTIVYRNDDSILISKTITVHCNISAIPAKKYMFIGDSYTEAGYMQNWFYDQNSGLVTLYGTCGTAPYLHEGRHGWRVQDYFSASKNDITNPFYNPSTQTFDFSYYMNNNPSFADVDVVNILLGRNNGFSTTIIDQIQRIVTSIHNYNANIKIYVMVGSNVAANNSGAGRYMQSNEEMNLSCFNYNRIVTYENATLIWQNCNLDDIYDFTTEQVQATLTNPTLVTMYTDNVHPNQYGYKAFGVVFNGYMHNFLNY